MPKTFDIFQDNQGNVSTTPPDPNAPVVKPPYKFDQKNPLGMYTPGQNMGPLRYSQPEIDYWTKEYAKQGKTIDAGWMQQQQQSMYDYAMASPANTYWENPQNVGRWMAVVNNLPDNVAPPEWLDVDTLKGAHSYFSSMFKNAPWWEWDKAVSTTDPARLLLRQMNIPDKADLPDWENTLQDQEQALQQIAQAETNPPQPSVFGEYKEGLPAWQYPLIALTSSAGQIGMGAVGGAAMGGSVAGPIGAVIGGAGLGVASAFATEEAKKMQDPNYEMPFWMKALQALDWLATQVEKGVGVAEQLTTNPGEVLANIPAAWEAGQFMYNVTDLANAAEYPGPISTLTGKKPEGKTEVWQLGETKPSDIWSAPDGLRPSEYALTQIRRGFANGTMTADQAAQFVYSKFGITGESRDLIGHMLLDPLNYAGPVVSKGIQLGNKAAVKLGSPSVSAKLAAETFGTSKGLLDDVRMFSQKARTQITVAEAASMDTVSKLFAGVSNNGLPKDFLTVESQRNAIEKFFSPNRYARAANMQSAAADGIGQLLQLEPDASKQVALLKQLIASSPESVVKAGDDISRMRIDVGGKPVDVDVPKYWQSPEGQSVLMALRNAGPDIDRLAEDLITSVPKRNFITDVANTHPDYGPGLERKLIADLTDGTAAQRKAILSRWEAGLKAAGNDPIAKGYLDQVQRAAIGETQLVNAADTFKGGKPFHNMEQTLALMDVITRSVDDFTVKYFNVKPDRMLTRLAKVIKTAQSYLLLGPNPTYLANNAISNMVHLASDGLLNASSLVGRKKYLAALYGDALPVHLRAGIGAAELGEGAVKIGEGLRAAGRASDAIQGIQDFLGKGQKGNRKWITSPFASMSQNVEQLSSEIAMTAGIRQYWGEFWQAGKGFDNISKVDPQLGQMLDSFIPGGAKKIEQMIARGKSKGEIEAQMFKGFQTKSIMDIATPEDRQLINAFPDLLGDALDEKIANAPNDSERIRILQDTNREVAQKVKDGITEQTKRTVEEGIARLQIDGSAQGLKDVLDNAVDSYDEFWQRHQDHMSEIFESGNQANISRELENSRIAWEANDQRRTAEWYGAIKAMNGADNVPQEWLPVFDLMTERANEWSTFFLERRDEGIKWANKEIDWQTYRQGLNDKYFEMVSWEHILNRLFDEMSAEQVTAKQPHLADDFTRWVNNRSEIRKGSMLSETLYRNGVIPPVDAAQLADRFMAQHPELAEKWGIKVHSYAEELAGSTAEPEIANLIGKLNKGKAEYMLDQGTRRANAKEYAKVRADYLRRMMDAKNDPPGTKPTVPPSVQVAAEAAMPVVKPVKPVTIYDTNKSVMPIMDALEAAAKEIGEPEGYFRSKEGNPVFRHIESSVQKYLGEKKRLIDFTQDDLTRYVDAWKKEHTQILADRAAKVAERAQPAPKETMIAPAPFDQVAVSAMAKADAAQRVERRVTPRPEGPAWTPEERLAAYQRINAEPYMRNKPDSELVGLGDYTPEELKAGQPAEWNAPTPIPTDADVRARVVQAERDASAKLAESMGEFDYGRKDLETALRKALPDQADDLLAVFDALAENFNPDLTAKEFYDRLGWKTGGTFGGGEGLKQIARPEWQSNAIDLYGLTDDPQKAGYIFQDGKMLDLNRDAGQRLIEHDLVAEMATGANANGTQAIHLFTENTGALRVDINSHYVEAMDAPSRKQIQSLTDALAQTNVGKKTITLAIDTPKGGKVHTLNMDNLGEDLTSIFTKQFPGLMQDASGTTHGLTTFTADMKALIRAYDSANGSTFAHEIIHGITPVMQQADADLIAAEWKRIGKGALPEDWHTQMKPVAEGQTTAVHTDVYEWLSRGFERYLADGKAPTRKLAEVFSRIKDWMLDVYKKITGSEIKTAVSEPVRQMFDKWLGGEGETKPAGKRTTASDYLNERFMYGGQEKTRAEIMQDLKAQGGTQGEIDAYMMGLERQTPITEPAAIAAQVEAPKNESIKPTVYASPAQNKFFAYRSLAGRKAAQFVEISKAKPVKLEGWDGYEFFTYKDGGVWHIIESQSGLAVNNGATSPTRAAAIADATNRLNKVGPDKVFDFVNTAINKQGTSPRYMAETPKGTPLLQRNTPPLPEPIAAQAGTADSLTQPPLDKAAWESYLKDIDPMMARWRSELTGQPAPTGGAMNIDALPKDVQLGLRRYLGKVYTQLNDVKIGATKWGEAKRNFALLDYSRRNDFDGLVGSIAPYQFWYTRSMMNWALRALEKPSIVTNYLRLQDFANRETQREGYPTRLKGKMGFYAPWMPEWAGDEIFMDPLRQLFPMTQFLRPFEQYGQTMNMIDRRAASLVDQWEQDKEITTDDANEARNNKAGQAWEKAYAQAEAETRGDSQETLGAPVQPGGTRNAMDLAFSILSPSLPLSVGYAWATGRKDTVGLLPLTKFVKNVSGALTGTAGTNIEAPLRKAFGWPENDRYEDYRFDAAMAQLMAEGQATADEAKRAMIDRSGPLYDLASKRVGQTGLIKYVGAPMGVDIFPEGEREVRALKSEYDLARTKWQAGSKTALSDFFEKYPEYEVRNDTFKTPEDRTRNYLKSMIWEWYNDANPAEKKEAAAQFGDQYTENFINAETRSYDSISTDTLASWANRVSAGQAPESLGQPAETKPLVGTAENKIMTQYQTEKDEQFPDLSGVQAAYYSMTNEAEKKAFEKAHPELKDYSNWRTAFAADNPSAIPYITSEESNLYGLPVDIQQVVYQYRATKTRMFGEIEGLQEQYFGITDKAQRKAYLAANPELSSYWDWRRQYAAQNPKAAPYILSAQSLANAINPGGNSGGSYGGYTASVPKLPEGVYNTVAEHMKNGVRLDLGIETEVNKLLVKYKVSTAITPDQWLRQVMAQQPAKDQTHPDVLSQSELAQIPPELVRALAANKLNGQQLGAGAWAQIKLLRDKFEIRKDISDDQFLAVYLLPALQ